MNLSAMRKYLNFILILLMTPAAIAQTDLCNENAKGSYWPIKAGTKLYYASVDNAFTSEFDADSVKHGDFFYFKETEHYAHGHKKIRYLRETNGMVYVYDHVSHKESIQLSKDLRPGNTWFNEDQTLIYTIVDTTGSFSTPYCEYTNLLQIRVEPRQNSVAKGNQTRFHFYKRGVGLVGVMTNGKPSINIKPEPSLLNEREAAMPGCEHLATELEIQACNYLKISDFIKNNYKNPIEKLKKGQIVFNVIVGKDGLVQDVYPINTIGKKDAQEYEAIRVLRSLPKFTPAQILDGKPVPYSFRIPFTF